jgi:predicted nucleotidyltransferase
MRSPGIPQSHIRFPLSALLGDSGHVRVLRTLLTYDGPLSSTQIAHEAALSRGGVRLVLESLISQGAVRSLGTPRSQLFSAVGSHQFVTALKTVFDTERTRWTALQKDLRDLLAQDSNVRSAWLYGSVARHEDTPESDVDVALALMTDMPTTEIRDELDALGERFGVHVAVVALTAADIAAGVAANPWWNELKRDAVVLKGVSPEQEASGDHHRTNTPHDSQGPDEIR